MLKLLLGGEYIFFCFFYVLVSHHVRLVYLRHELTSQKDKYHEMRNRPYISKKVQLDIAWFIATEKRSILLHKFGVLESTATETTNPYLLEHTSFF